jgi:hypothetical protein
VQTTIGSSSTDRVGSRVSRSCAFGGQVEYLSKPNTGHDDLGPKDAHTVKRWIVACFAGDCRTHINSCLLRPSPCYRRLRTAPKDEVGHRPATHHDHHGAVARFGNGGIPTLVTETYSHKDAEASVSLNWPFQESLVGAWT